MSTTLNMSYQSNPESVAQGGMGIATNTAYGLLAAGTTATGPVQQIGTGTTGQIYKAGGASALGSFVDQKSSTCMQLISTQTASNSASVSFSSLSSTYFAYKILLDSIVPANAVTNLQMQVNGVTSGYQYGLFNVTTGGTATNPAATFSAGMVITAAAGLGNAGAANNWEITLINPAGNIGNYPVLSAGKYSTITVWGCGYASGAGVGANPITSILFQIASGNITSGTFKLYGILA